MRERRRKIWIDQLQTRMFRRLVLYFVLYHIAVWSLVLIERRVLFVSELFLGPGMAAYYFFFMAVPIAFLGFMFTYDAIQFLHRIVGPLYRFRQVIKAVTAGEPVPLITLREGDQLLEMRDELNEMLQALAARGAVVLKTAPQKETQPAVSPTQLLENAPLPADR
jgi:hypothetical protein